VTKKFVTWAEVSSSAEAGTTGGEGGCQCGRKSFSKPRRKRAGWGLSGEGGVRIIQKERKRNQRNKKGGSQGRSFHLYDKVDKNWGAGAGEGTKKKNKEDCVSDPGYQGGGGDGGGQTENFSFTIERLLLSWESCNSSYIGSGKLGGLTHCSEHGRGDLIRMDKGKRKGGKRAGFLFIELYDSEGTENRLKIESRSALHINRGRSPRSVIRSSEKAAEMLPKTE